MTFGRIFQRTVTMLFIVSIMLFSAVTHAEVKTYTGEGAYVMSKFENLEIARERAKIDAMRNACEKAGTYVKSYSRARNFELEEDIIETMTSNILKLVEKPIFQMLEQVDNLEGIMIRVTIKAQIDDSDITRWLNKNDNEKSTLVAQNEALRKFNEEQERQIAELKRQLANNPQDKEQITQALADEDKIFLSNQKVDAAWKLYDNGDYHGAISLNNAALIHDPSNALAYYARGTTYMELNQYNLAIEDFNKAIQLKPDYVDAYNNRGIAFMSKPKKEHIWAIDDYSKALELNPNYVKVYNNRANAYFYSKRYTAAIQDYNKAIELKPTYADAYANRGLTYYHLGEYYRAIQDFDMSIALNPNLWQPYYNRGKSYREIGEEAKAQEDFAKAKELGWKG